MSSVLCYRKKSYFIYFTISQFYCVQTFYLENERKEYNTKNTQNKAQ